MPANKTCPFRVGTIDVDDIALTNPADTYICIGEKCQIWDTEADDCSLASLGTITQTHLSMFSHWHNKHEHGKTHVCSDLGLDCGWTFQPIQQVQIPLASQLISEFNLNQDMDMNGKVYGYDFQVADGPDKPIILLSIESSPMWTPHPTQVSWTDLINWWTSGGLDPLA